MLVSPFLEQDRAPARITAVLRDHFDDPVGAEVAVILTQFAPGNDDPHPVSYTHLTLPTILRV